ncbi:DUF2490 domain-containing protein [Flagellimonas sp. 389]|uniref:DUF2490 domain-containing protein n=1 Tax=Flagellimonas sp. 389 TaxID=2835862 RepID=UPI001BD2801C|nr:DUF2490 domain-containing protein [Flagellimonas sp. 389]MBS9462422.1 DUF2490 domain-containing protein [Flagellimonas sp. 389]
MFSTRWLLPSCFLWTSFLASQENLTGYLQPQAAINYSLSKTYSHNLSMAKRSFFIEEGDFGARIRHVDLVHFSNLKLADNKSIALGVQYRFRNNFEDNPNELRLTQQYNFTKRPFVIRFGHRFRAEQRITEPLTTHRFRYRFAVDFPLKGEKLNVGEPYFVGGFENLLSVAKGNSSEYDTRISGQVGWQLPGGLKVQGGIEYRMEDYTSGLPQNVVFLLTNIQLSL